MWGDVGTVVVVVVVVCDVLQVADDDEPVADGVGGVVWVLALDARCWVAAVVVLVHCASVGLHRHMNKQRTKSRLHRILSSGCQSFIRCLVFDVRPSSWSIIVLCFISIDTMLPGLPVESTIGSTV